MIRVNPINLNNNNRKISFKENSANNITPSVAVLSLQNPNAWINFKRDAYLTQKADAVQSNPLSALPYKIIKTFEYLFTPEVSKKAEEIKKENKEYSYYYLG